MDISATILRTLRKKGEVRTSEIARATGFTRAYVHKVLQQLQREGAIVRVGKANRARYIPATAEAIQKEKSKELTYRRNLLNKNLSEDDVWQEIRRETGIILGLPENVQRIVAYSFTEMLNNAIEHSGSETIVVRMQRTNEGVSFQVVDHGVGIFEKIMQQRKLHSHQEAIQDLLKGKQTTDPEHHSGEGIFFTSKAADILSIKSSRKQIIFDNRLEDVFVKNASLWQGTTIEFFISRRSERNLQEIFERYTGETFEFGKTEVKVDLYQEGTSYVSRSQARRLLFGLEKFNTIILDFKGIETIGQGFADEIFRVWRQQYPHITVNYLNANENVEFMIRHVSGLLRRT